jgi:hypothetical protein
VFREKGFGTPDPAKRVEIKAEPEDEDKPFLDFFDVLRLSDLLQDP